MNKYFSVTIDTECDKDKEWRVTKPFAFKSVTEAVPAVLQPVFDKFGIKPVYLLSPEVIADDASVSVLKNAKEKGAELGTHLHGEFIGPGENLETEKTYVSQSILNPVVEYEKLENLTKLFSEKFGFNPVSFRAGRFGLGSETFNNLKKLGYKVDSSVTPFLKWKDEWVDANYINSHYQPYFTSKDRDGILEVPVTVLNSDLINSPGFVRYVISKFPRLLRVFKKLRLNKSETLMFRPPVPSMTIEKLRSIVDFYDELLKGSNVFLVMMFHNVDLVPGCSPYCDNLPEQSEYLKRLEEIFGYLNERNYESITLSDVYKKMLK